MRAMLVVNPKATATSERQRDILTRALGSDLKVDLAQTTHRGHAIEYAAQAKEQGLDIVVVLGGDGTINEVVNGLLGSGPWPGNATERSGPRGRPRREHQRLQPSARHRARPGRGHQRAARRAPRRPHPADRPRSRRRSLVHLHGRPRDRRRRRTPGREGTRERPASDAVALHPRDGARPARDGPPPRARSPSRFPAKSLEPGLFLGIAANTAPWTYFRSKPIVLTPDVTFDTGLDLVALSRMGLLGTLWSASGMITAERHPRQACSAVSAT